MTTEIPCPFAELVATRRADVALTIANAIVATDGGTWPDVYRVIAADGRPCTTVFTALSGPTFDRWHSAAAEPPAALVAAARRFLGRR